MRGGEGGGGGGGGDTTEKRLLSLSKLSKRASCLMTFMQISPLRV